MNACEEGLITLAMLARRQREIKGMGGKKIKGGGKQAINAAWTVHLLFTLTCSSTECVFRPKSTTDKVVFKQTWKVQTSNILGKMSPLVSMRKYRIFNNIITLISSYLC